MKHRAYKKRKERQEIEDSKRLIIEITESEGILNYREVVEFMMEARKHGIRFAIDDFGSGYSNFTYLMDLNVDYIKIDGSIISSILWIENNSWIC